MKHFFRRAAWLLPFFWLLLPRCYAFCFAAAGERYKLDPLLLTAIATCESNLNPQALGKNRNKQGQVISCDYGLMQINSLHLARLKAQGIITDARDLLNNSCLNVQVGAWILASHMQRCGSNYWSCVGSYNAGFKPGNEPARRRYAQNVARVYQRLMTEKSAS